MTETFIPQDAPGVIRRCISSINTACDWAEQGDIGEAIALLNFCLDDLEQLAAHDGAALDKAA